MIEYLKITAAETPYLVREPDEITITHEQEVNLIRNKANADGELLLIAVIDGEHAGNCSLMNIAPCRRYRHRCGIAAALYQKYCGCGIGKQMMETVLEAAKKAGYEQAELEVVSGNRNAIALYRKLGSRKIRHIPGQYEISGRYICKYRLDDEEVISCPSPVSRQKRSRNSVLCSFFHTPKPKRACRK